VLRYDPDDDPRAVRVDLPGAHRMTVARTLLEQGLRAPAGTGEVRVWPCGRVQAVVEFHSAQGVAVVQAGGHGGDTAGPIVAALLKMG
ncbi:SsgA family sporulation/cell division regulator, partial [Streptomyces niveiscabiei]|uniref:SsgA family sporulation/cell division regulator n=1 Tax=Streptomyces niveiscabiei TaxID=164115 RepID=UPI000B204CD0